MLPGWPSRSCGVGNDRSDPWHWPILSYPKDSEQILCLHGSLAREWNRSFPAMRIFFQGRSNFRGKNLRAVKLPDNSVSSLKTCLHVEVLMFGPSTTIRNHPTQPSRKAFADKVSRLF